MLSSIVDLSSLVIFLVTFLALYIVYRSRSHSHYPPSLPWLPVVGSLPFMYASIKTMPRMFMERSVALGDVFSFYAGSKLVVVINGREAIHEALVTRATDFADRDMPFVLKHFNLRQSPGLITRPYDADFKKYQHQCLTILKEFGFGKRIMETRIAIEVSHLVDFIQKQKGEAFDYQDILTTSVINVIHAILFGSRREHTDPTLLQLIHHVNTIITNIIPEFDLLPVLRFLPSYRRRLMRSLGLNKEIKQILIGCIQHALDSESADESFVRCFAEGGGDRSEIPGIVQDLLVAGSETSTTTLRWSLVMLANHPQVQDRLHKEIDSVVHRDRFPALDDKPSLPYVEAVMLELMRRKTLAPLAVPHKTLCDTECGGYLIPKGTKVLANLYSAHMDPRAWKDPTAFRPERFLDIDGNITGKNLVIPFSLGKRSCLGEQLARQELFLFFTGLLQHFEIRPPEGQDLIDSSENWRATMFPSPFKVRLVPRSVRMEE